MGFDEQRARFALAAAGPPEQQTADAAVRWLLARAGEELAPELLRGRVVEERRAASAKPTVPTLLDRRRATTYPACCVKRADPSVKAAHDDRVAFRTSRTARSAADDLASLEALLASGRSGGDALSEARALKAKVDEAVADGRLPELEPGLRNRIGRGLRALAFS